jgi:hypothetical protein
MPINEQRISDVESEKRVEALLAALRRSRRGTRPPALRLGQTLDELDAWLADDRQWHQGGSRHWRTLLDDVREALKMVTAMSDSPLQEELGRLAQDLQTLRGQFGGTNDPPDDALRRRLRRISSATRATVLHTDILLSSFRRIGVWASDDPQRAEDGVGVLRDLAELHGHDSVDLLKRVDGVLSDTAWEIAALREEELASAAIASAGASAAERLALVEKLLGQPARSVGGVVWLEFLQAHLHHPWILPLGPAVTLFAHDFLRPTIHQAPDDERIPDELREDNHDFLKSWLDADNAETAVLADHEVHGDPRVYLRMELDAMPPMRLLAAARETAEFIVAFGALAADNHDIWLLSDSYYTAGHEASTSASMINLDKAAEQLAHDQTAVQLARHAEALGRHLPLRTPELQIAGRLLVWLRQATANDNPARLVLCDRVAEQVCGWAGIAQRERFVTNFLRPTWVYEQIRAAINFGYRQLYSDMRGQAHRLTSVIETDADRPPYSVAVHLPSINLRAVLEHVNDLIDIAPDTSEARVRLEELKQRTADRSAVNRWLDKLDEQFDKSNARLRRARNALMHGGPLVTSSIDDVAHFSTNLAYMALGVAVNLLLNDEDVTDGFLDQQQNHLRCFSQLREGVPARDALFWAGSV